MNYFPRWIENSGEKKNNSQVLQQCTRKGSVKEGGESLSNDGGRRLSSDLSKKTKIIRAKEKNKRMNKGEGGR